ncbi:MAG TPA: flagellar biosynthetic protein FliR, partial [Vampirovibrionales bacterium]
MEAEGLKFIFDNWMSSFMLVLARVLGFAHIGPVLSRTSVPVLVRLGVSLALAVIMSPLIKAAPNDYLSYNFFLSLFLNILAGLFIGFLTRLVVDVVQVTGEVLDNEMGLNSVSLFDPNLGQVTSLSLFFETFGTVLFIWIGGFEITLITFLKSFEIFPLVASDFSSFQISMPTVLSLTNNVVTLGIIGASPIII